MRQSAFKKATKAGFSAERQHLETMKLIFLLWVRRTLLRFLFRGFKKVILDIHSMKIDPLEKISQDKIYKVLLRFIRGENTLEQLSRTRVFTGFKNPALFFPAT